MNQWRKKIVRFKAISDDLTDTTFKKFCFSVQLSRKVCSLYALHSLIFPIFTPLHNIINNGEQHSVEPCYKHCIQVMWFVKGMTKRNETEKKSIEPIALLISELCLSEGIS